jgi:hypothetical protein
VCTVLVEWNEETVLVAIPIFVGDAYFPPEPTTTPTEGTATEPPQDTGDNNPQPTQAPQPTQVPDSDGDGVPDDQDACPNQPGDPNYNGCVPPRPTSQND